MIKVKSKKIALIVVLFLITISTAILLVSNGINIQNRQAMIHHNGSQVMPFDLDTTRHIFKPTIDGGIQQVVAMNPGDSDQIRMIREHLKMEEKKFSKGDFSDPALLHGNDMPGLGDLRKGSSHIRITFSEIPNGGQISYKTSDPGLIKAIHEWFDAQLSDHGKDAMRM